MNITPMLNQLIAKIREETITKSQIVSNIGAPVVYDHVRDRPARQTMVELGSTFYEDDVVSIISCNNSAMWDKEIIEALRFGCLNTIDVGNDTITKHLLDTRHQVKRRNPKTGEDEPLFLIVHSRFFDTLMRETSYMGGLAHYANTIADATIVPVGLNDDFDAFLVTRDCITVKSWCYDDIAFQYNSCESNSYAVYKTKIKIEIDAEKCVGFSFNKSGEKS